MTENASTIVINDNNNDDDNHNDDETGVMVIVIVGAVVCYTDTMNGDSGNEPEKKSSLERLQEKLYTKGSELPSGRRSFLRMRQKEPRNDWEHEAVISEEQTRKKQFLSMKNIFIISLGFFAVAASVFAFVFFGGTNLISNKNVEILVSAPVSVEAGKELALQIIIENKNNVALESADLLIEYPEGTHDSQNLEKPLQRVKKPLGPIGRGEVVTNTERVVFFGQEGDEKNIHIVVEYRLKDSNAIFVSEKDYTLHVSASSIRLTVDTLKEINSGKEFSIKVEVSSNSNQVLQDLLVSVEYPFGFSYTDAVPKPLYGKNIWSIGDLPPGATRTIEIKGIIEGQDGEEKIFRFASGIPSALDPRSIGIAYASLLEGVVIARPFLDLTLTLDGASQKEYIAQGEQTIQAEISWFNNLPTKIIEAHIEARLVGPALDQTSVQVPKGFYRSFDNTIIWDAGTLEDLAEIESGERGVVTFRFSSVPLLGALGSALRDPEIRIEVDVRAKRLSERGVPEEIVSSASSAVKIESEAGLTQRAVHFVGPFTNTGSMPPASGKETTYTIVWTLVNSSNTLVGGVVTATLPPYARFTGNILPGTEELIYVQEGRTVRWNVGTVRPGIGISLPAREVAFQIAFLPSISQIGTIPILAGAAEFIAHDQFTNTEIKKTAREVTTALSSDPRYERDQGAVQ